MIEIERKFLVNNLDFLDQHTSKNRIVQGYLNSNPERTVRIRIKGEKGFVTIKGKGNETNTSRLEWEKEIPVEEAQLLLSICEEGVIDKTRYVIPFGQHIFEVDIFEGENKGLILAEIELNDENESFEKPDWLAEEVTQDNRYFNSYLSKSPFTKW